MRQVSSPGTRVVSARVSSLLQGRVLFPPVSRLSSSFVQSPKNIPRSSPRSRIHIRASQPPNLIPSTSPSRRSLPISPVRIPSHHNMLPLGTSRNILAAICVAYCAYQGWQYFMTSSPAIVIEIRKPGSTETVTKSSETIARICRAYAAILLAVPTNRPPSLYEYLHIADTCAPSPARSKSSSSARRCSTHQIYLAVESTLIEYFPAGGYFSSSSSSSSSSNNNNKNPNTNNRDINDIKTTNDNNNNNAVVTALVTSILFDEDTRIVYDHLFEPALAGGATDRIKFLERRCGEAWRR
ncbi:hypothetical protein CTA2_7122 [Colletotrichum tanaceti]|nr:hypothetical protein CTA2_7122 [Colletotrichum tanaceti]